MDVTSGVGGAPRPWPWIAAMAGVLVLMLGFVGLASRPGDARLSLARSALAEAGFVDAQISRGQSPSEMSKCEVGQVWKRGYAYAWRTESANGIFCMRIDGRPNRIIVDRPSQPTRGT